MSPDQDVLAVLSSYFPRPEMVRQIEPLGSGGGWSGSRLWRVEGTALGAGLPTPPGRRAEFCLRRWPPEHPTRKRLEFIHAVVKRVASALHAVANPIQAANRSTIVEHANHLWELTAWMPGAADFHTFPSTVRLRSAMRSLACFHSLAATLECHRGVAPTIVDRQHQLGELLGGGIRDIERALRTPLGSEIDRRSGPLLALSRKALCGPNIARVLAIDRELTLQPAIRDIHHDHVLFTGDEVTGIIDFGALRIDTPLADVARLVGSLVGDNHEARKFALDAYAELRPLSDADRQLIDLLDESGLVLSGLNWLTWLYLERRDIGKVGPIARRLDEILKRLDARATVPPGSQGPPWEPTIPRLPPR